MKNKKKLLMYVLTVFLIISVGFNCIEYVPTGIYNLTNQKYYLSSDFKGINYENFADNQSNYRQYESAKSYAKNMIISDLLQGKGIDTTFVRNIQYHINILELLKDTIQQENMSNHRENFDCILDSLYLNYMESIHFIYAYNKKDSLWVTEESEVYKMYRKYTYDGFMNRQRFNK